MTDLRALAELLDRLGVVYVIEHAPFNPEREPPTAQHIIIESGTGSKNTGYYGFFTEFEFDAHGQFVRVGAWE